MRRVVIAIVAGLAALAPGNADAAYGPGASLVSASPTRLEQADENVQSAVISQDGRYAVFQTTARNLYPDGDPGDPPGQIRNGGIFRRDLVTGALDLVAYGDLRTQTNALVARGAQSPSVSADGRFVAFSTGWKLVTADANNNLDVYVRDMTRPISDPGGYQLASAKDGGATPAVYGSTFLTQGADTPTGTSLSSDGTRVLFRTSAPSDLPNAATAGTPAGQLFVRDLAASTTTLVTRSATDGSPAGGVPSVQPYAALSADGTTVVWSGQNATKQTRFLARETPNDGTFLNYMWRRIADGPDAPTRRITGPVDLDDSACTPALEELYDDRASSTGPCYGVLQAPEGDIVGGQLQAKAPVLSADGYRVAFLTGILPRGFDGITQFDLYLTDMRPGVSRKQGTAQLTTHNLSFADGATNNPVLSVAMSANGRRLAFVTGRTTFLLSSLRLVEPPLPTPGIEQLYVVDLNRSTIQLASRGLDGDGANQSVGNFVSMSEDGKRIAFASGATNLYSGDANTKADAFVVTDGTDSTTNAAAEEPPFSGYSSPDGRGGSTAATKLKLRFDHGHGRIRLKVRVPGPGRVTASARSSKGAIARASSRSKRAGETTLVLRPRSRFRKALRRKGRLTASVSIRFTPAGQGATLTAKRRVTFKR